MTGYLCGLSICLGCSTCVVGLKIVACKLQCSIEGLRHYLTLIFSLRGWWALKKCGQPTANHAPLQLYLWHNYIPVKVSIVSWKMGKVFSFRQNIFHIIYSYNLEKNLGELMAIKCWEELLFVVFRWLYLRGLFVSNLNVDCSTIFSSLLTYYKIQHVHN